MQTSTYTVTTITATEGHMLTQAEAVDPQFAIIAETVYLGVGDSADNYREITADEAEALRQARDAAAKAATEARLAAMATEAEEEPGTGDEEREGEEASGEGEASEVQEAQGTFGS